MQYDLCRHIKTNGTQCGSPALDAHAFCFYHHRLHRRHAAFRHVPAPRGSGSLQLELSPLEDRDAIQSALSLIIHALAAGQLENSRATALFYGLQLASNNAARLASAPYPPNILTETTSDAEGLDIAPPGNTRTLTTDIADELYEPGELPEYDDDDKDKEDETQSEEALSEEQDKHLHGQHATHQPDRKDLRTPERLWWENAHTLDTTHPFNHDEPSSSPRLHTITASARTYLRIPLRRSSGSPPPTQPSRSCLDSYRC